jgi:hypothetical protein
MHEQTSFSNRQSNNKIPPKAWFCGGASGYPRENLRGLFRQMARYGKGRRKFTRKHREALTLNQLVPAAFVAGLICLICSLALYLFTGAYVPLLLTAIPYGLYLALVLAETVRITLRYGASFGMPIPAIIFVIHFALGYGFLKETFYIPEL